MTPAEQDEVRRRQRSRAIIMAVLLGRLRHPRLCDQHRQDGARQRMRRTTRTALLLGGLVFGMTGLAFASVPLYRVFCQLTGFARHAAARRGRQRAGRDRPDDRDPLRRQYRPALPWQFRPVEQRRTVPIGSRNIALYTARNDFRRAVTGQASFNVTPSQAGRYFTKIQCFCFTEQTLRPGQEVQMPVTFYVDPAILDDPDARNISEITLSYTFYPVDRRRRRS